MRSRSVAKIILETTMSQTHCQRAEYSRERGSRCSYGSSVVPVLGEKWRCTDERREHIWLATCCVIIGRHGRHVSDHVHIGNSPRSTKLDPQGSSAVDCRVVFAGHAQLSAWMRRVGRENHGRGIHQRFEQLPFSVCQCQMVDSTALVRSIHRRIIVLQQIRQL